MQKILLLLLLGSFFETSGCTLLGVSKQDATDIASTTARTLAESVTTSVAAEVGKAAVDLKGSMALSVEQWKARAVEVGKVAAADALDKVIVELEKKSKEKQDKGENNTLYLGAVYVLVELRKAWQLTKDKEKKPEVKA